MRKKIALFLAAIMVVGTLPMTAFAKTDNQIDRVKTIQDGKTFTAELIIDDIDTATTNTIKLALTNAQWATDDAADITGPELTKAADEYSKTKAFVEFFDADEDGKVVITMNLKAKGEGEATVTIEDVDSDVTEETLKVANIIDGATLTTIDDTTALNEGDTEIEAIVIEEVVPGTMGGDTAKTLKLRLVGGFEWTVAPSVDKKVGDGTLAIAPKEIENGTGADKNIDGRDAYYTVTGKTDAVAAVFALTDGEVFFDEDDVDFGTDCELVVSGAGVDTTTLLVGTATDYAVTFTAEDDDLVKVWAGEDTEKEVLEVTIKEVIDNSWIHQRVADITFPEGIKAKVVSVTPATGVSLTPNKDWDEFELKIADTVADIDIDIQFAIEAAADFEGDVEVTLSGTATGTDDQTVVVATVAPKYVVEADTNELVIDYRNTAASDIVITEAKAGLWEKGEVIALELDEIRFEGKPTVTVEEGDMKIEKVKEDEGVISFQVKQESVKEAAVIRISGVELYMERNLPAGEYDLSIVANDAPATTVAFENDNYGLDADHDFDVEDITVCEGYVTIVTAGRDQDDSTFTTKVAVTIGADTMTAGSQTIALDVPAYIAGGYTMLPVRAVAEALSDAAIVKWDDATKTVVIFFGQRTISMTIGSKVMVVNGVDVAMSAAPEITNGRTFLPLRDLGYALGLGEEKIAWDDVTKTATLN